MINRTNNTEVIKCKLEEIAKNFLNNNYVDLSSGLFQIETTKTNALYSLQLEQERNGFVTVLFSNIHDFYNAISICGKFLSTIFYYSDPIKKFITFENNNDLNKATNIFTEFGLKFEVI